MKDICARIANEMGQEYELIPVKGNIFDMMNFAPNRGAFEVYFMGIKLFSKIQCKMWPNIPILADKCVKCYRAYVKNQSLDQFEIVERPLSPVKD